MTTHTITHPSPERGGTYKWKALATVAVGNIMATMDASITNIAFPTLTKVFRTDITTVMWVTVAYVLVSTSSMLVIGKISDSIGRKRIYTLGMGIFTVGLLACSLAQGVGQLIAFRALQAVGAAMTISCSMAIVTEAFPSHETGKGIGYIAMSVSLGFILGPVFGGFILDWLDWRAVFYLRIPIGILSFLLALVLLRPDQGGSGPVHLDLMGTLTSSAGIFLFVFGVAQIRYRGFSSPLVHVLVGAGLVLLIVFVLVERAVKNPIVDLSLFRNLSFSRAMWSLFLTFVAAPPYILIMPFYLIEGRNLNPSQAGLMLAVVSVTTMIVGPVSGSLSDRFGPSRFSVIGAGLIGVAYCLLFAFDLQTPLAALVPVLIVLGTGVGSFHPSNNSIIMGSVAHERLGTASALTATQRHVGMSVGMAITGTLFSTRRLIHESLLRDGGLSDAVAAVQSVPPAFHDVLVFGISLQCIVVILCFVRGKTAASRPG